MLSILHSKQTNMLKAEKRLDKDRSVLKYQTLPGNQPMDITDDNPITSILIL